MTVRSVASVVAVAVALVITVPSTASAQAADDAPPTASLSNGSGRPGETVEVIGKGWPGQTIIQVELCGNLRLNGSVDCLRQNAVTKAADENGSFAATLPIGIPPTPCPCVVSVATFDGRSPVDLPYEVVGAPTAPPSRSEATFADFRLTEVEVVDEPSLGARFGASDTRTVEATVRNVGEDPIPLLPVVATVGRGDDPTRPADAAELRDLEPGERRTVQLTIPLDAMSTGTYTVLVRAGEGGRAVTRPTTVSTFPWLLALVVLIVGVTVLVVLFSRLTRSRRAEAEEGEAEGLDAREMERDLATQIEAAIAGLTDDDWSGGPDALAGRLATSITATVAARHPVDATARTSMEAGLREELTVQLHRLRPPATAEGP